MRGKPVGNSWKDLSLIESTPNFDKFDLKKPLQKFTLCFCFPFTGGASWIVIFLPWLLQKTRHQAAKNPCLKKRPKVETYLPKRKLICKTSFFRGLVQFGGVSHRINVWCMYLFTLWTTQFWGNRVWCAEPRTVWSCSPFSIFCLPKQLLP